MRFAERIVHMLAVFCILSWRIFWMTMLQRSSIYAVPELVFAELETDVLARMAPTRTRVHPFAA